MARTVNSAFQAFLTNNINLDKDEVGKARKSRDWLIDKIRGFSDEIVFATTTNHTIHFGSFARSTKIRPLDDIDIMFCLNGENCKIKKEKETFVLVVESEEHYLEQFCYADSNVVNSRLLVNFFVKKLQSISQYSKAEIKRNLEAATLNLPSYTWVFDIVPCFFVPVESYLFFWERGDFYLINDRK